MNWLDEVQIKIKRKNQILFSKDSTFLADLEKLLKYQNHRTLVLWSLELAEQSSHILKKRYPNENRLEYAVQMSKDWASGNGNITMAKQAILHAHAVAKEIHSLEDIAICHAIGQACSVVHTSKHALGFPIYELTSIVRHFGLSECKKILEDRKQYYVERINYWSNHYNDEHYTWAEFLKKI